MRDVTKLTDDDIPTMTIDEEVAYYEANADRLDEIFDGEPVQFVSDPDITLTERDGILMSFREARTYDAKQAWKRAHPEKANPNARVLVVVR